RVLRFLCPRCWLGDLPRSGRWFRYLLIDEAGHGRSLSWGNCAIDYSSIRRIDERAIGTAQRTGWNLRNTRSRESAAARLGKLLLGLLRDERASCADIPFRDFLLKRSFSDAAHGPRELRADNGCRDGIFRGPLRHAVD